MQFDVTVCRTAVAFATIRVEADDADMAEHVALNNAGDHTYTEKDADYTAQGVSPVKEPGADK